MLTLSKGLDDKHEMQEGEEDNVKLIEAREDTTEAFEPPEEPFDLVSLAGDGLVVRPRFQAVAFRGNHRNEAEIRSQLAGFVVFVGTIHDEVQGCGQWSDTTKKLASSLGIGGLARREREGYSRSSIRGNHMNLGGPSAAGFANGLGAVFFNAPAPSG